MSDTIIAGGLAGFVTPFIYTPTELIKINLQAQDGHTDKKFSGPIDVFKKIYSQKGIKGLFNGNLICIAREIPANIAYFGTYETLKRYVFPHNEDGSTPLYYSIVGGSCAGVLNWAVSLPQDVIKSRLALHIPHINTVSLVIKDIYHNQGIKGFFRGFTPAVVR